MKYLYPEKCRFRVLLQLTLRMMPGIWLLSNKHCCLLFSCWVMSDCMDRRVAGSPVLHHLLEFAQNHSSELAMPSNHLALCQPLHLLSSVFPSIRLSHWVGSSHQVVEVLELQLHDYNSYFLSMQKIHGFLVLVWMGEQKTPCLGISILIFPFLFSIFSFPTHYYYFTNSA